MFGPKKTNIRRSPRAKPSFSGIRRYNRCDLETNVVVQDADGWEIPVDSIDISPTGIFVSSDYLFEVGEEHTLIFQIEGRGMYRLRARVARVEHPEGEENFATLESRPGMGYEFVETEEQTWHELCEVVAGV